MRDRSMVIIVASTPFRELNRSAACAHLGGKMRRNSKNKGGLKIDTKCKRRSIILNRIISFHQWAVSVQRISICVFSYPRYPQERRYSGACGVSQKWLIQAQICFYFDLSIAFRRTSATAAAVAWSGPMRSFGPGKLHSRWHFSINVEP